MSEPQTAGAGAAGGRGGGGNTCPVCGRTFRTAKAVHGHMRSHPEREWRGMSPAAPPAKDAAGAAAQKPQDDTEEARREAAEKPYQCKQCKARYPTRQALGGHRASHHSKKGCHRLGREQAEASGHGGGGGGRGGLMEKKIAVDLNVPAQADDEE